MMRSKNSFENLRPWCCFGYSKNFGYVGVTVVEILKFEYEKTLVSTQHAEVLWCGGFLSSLARAAALQQPLHTRTQSHMQYRVHLPPKLTVPSFGWWHLKTHFRYLRGGRGVQAVPIFGTTKVRSAFSTNAQISFASVVLESVLGTFPFSATHLTVYLILYSSGCNARGNFRALEGSETERRDLLEGMEQKSVSPTRGHWFAVQANQCFLGLAPLIFDCLRPPC